MDETALSILAQLPQLRQQLIRVLDTMLLQFFVVCFNSAVLRANYVEFPEN